MEGTSLRELATAVRIEVGCDMLEHGDATISEITQSLGFAQPASFTRAFVAATSETPQAYRKRTRDR
jgi:AraC-like DNA-binding protein